MALIVHRPGGLAECPGKVPEPRLISSLIFVLLAAGIVTVSYRPDWNYERNCYSATERQLSAIADLKVEELMPVFIAGSGLRMPMPF